MENGELLRDIHEKVSKSEQWQVDADKKWDEMAKFMRPDGVCEKARHRINRIATQVGFQWWLIGAIALVIVGGALKLWAGGGG